MLVISELCSSGCNCKEKIGAKTHRDQDRSNDSCRDKVIGYIDFDTVVSQHQDLRSPKDRRSDVSSERTRKHECSSDNQPSWSKEG